MNHLKVSFAVDGSASIFLEGQHISRMKPIEVRSLISSLLVFGGKELRDDIKKWLDGGTIETVAEYIAPEPEKVGA
jgi:hypothetical protein